MKKNEVKKMCITLEGKKDKKKYPRVKILGIKASLEVSN